MMHRETVVVFGVLVGLIGATVIPFALPVLQPAVQGSTPTPTPARAKSEPAAVSPATPTATAETSARTTPSTETRTHTPRPQPQATLGSPDISCGTQSATGLPDSYPISVAGQEVTGDGVSVAVIDPSGFDIDDPRIADGVMATKSFYSRESRTIRNGGSNHHGTESAALVSRVAADADLYLANFQTAVDFTDAIDWAIERDVDVIVAPVAFYAKPNDGSSPVARAVTKALDAGIPVVVPTGNVATKHWEGTYTGGGWLEFEPDDTRLYLRGDDRAVQVWLWWNETAESGPNDFRVVLYEDSGGSSTRIAESNDYPKGPVGTNQVLFEKIRTNNFLAETIENGTYYLRIKGPSDVTHRIELVAASHPLEDPVMNGSLMAPATAKGSVIAVGAARRAGDGPLKSSSRGPTNDGRIGIDVMAPGTFSGPSGATFTGTSAASAYTGGVVALLSEVNPGLTPGRTEAIVQATADPVVNGTDSLATGYGMVDPDHVLSCGRNLTSAGG